MEKDDLREDCECSSETKQDKETARHLPESSSRTTTAQMAQSPV
jgi:hypothetical protein